MAIASVLLAFGAFVSLGLGLIFTWLPIWGAVFSFGAPVLSLVGVMLAGTAMSSAKKRGQESGLALTGVIMNVLAFLPAFAVAMTCGLCNACVSAGNGKPQLQWKMNMPLSPPPADDPAGQSGVSAPPPFPETQQDTDARDAATSPTPQGSTNAPAAKPDLPPPPLSPGPTR